MMTDMMFVVMDETTGAGMNDMVAVKSSSGLVERRVIWAVSLARVVVSGLAVSGALDGLFAKIDGGEFELTGDGGFVTELIKASVERGLVVELTDHLGYEKGDPDAGAFPNAGNGSTPETVGTQAGDVDLGVPRNRRWHAPPLRLAS
jgi:putative transposase